MTLFKPTSLLPAVDLRFSSCTKKGRSVEAPNQYGVERLLTSFAREQNMLKVSLADMLVVRDIIGNKWPFKKENLAIMHPLDGVAGIWTANRKPINQNLQQWS